MKCLLNSAVWSMLSIALLAGCGKNPPSPDDGRQSAFRVRTDFTAALNSDQGWGGALNENVTVAADRPFRVRLEVDQPAGAMARAPFRLQYRRNGGDWNDAEAHDFPHPLRELELDLAKAQIDPTLEGGTARLYTTPWPATEFGATFRLPAGDRHGFGLVFGYVDAANHWRIFLDPGAGVIRASRFVNGREEVAAQKRTAITLGSWHDIEIEIDTEGKRAVVSYDDGAVEMEVPIAAAIPPLPFGFHVPANSTVEFRDLAAAGDARTPRVSIVSCPAYEDGTKTTDLLKGAASARELEWAIVIRRYADGPVANEEGDTFELRMVDAGGAAFAGSRNPVLRLTIPPGHVGGTFVETPGVIGPWQARNGDLYFIMEPTETNNVFMMIKSTDNGVTWREVDGAHRPETNDLESVDARQVGDTIHIIHQVTNSIRYHAFRTSDHVAQPDSWGIRDELAATLPSVAQAATLAVRSDGSMAAFYVADTVHYNIRSREGVWGADTVLDRGVAPKSAGPKAVLGANDTVHVAYYGMDGTIWYRRLMRDGTLTPKQPIASGLGTSRADYGTVLPLVFIPKTNTVVIIYRHSDGRLWERRVAGQGTPTPATRVTDRVVIQDAVDSQQPAADAVVDGETVRVLFVEESSRSIFSTHDDGGWQPSTLRVDKILGTWIRGNVYTRRDGKKVHGYIYDAGSDGGAGMNRFGEIELAAARQASARNASEGSTRVARRAGQPFAKTSRAVHSRAMSTRRKLARPAARHRLALSGTEDCGPPRSGRYGNDLAGDIAVRLDEHVHRPHDIDCLDAFVDRNRHGLSRHSIL